MGVALVSPLPSVEVLPSLTLILQSNHPNTGEAATAAPQTISVNWGGPQVRGFRTESQEVALCFLPSKKEIVKNNATTFIFVRHLS